MGYINSNAAMKRESCANDGNGHKHPRPCSADHIGPISLGFCHRPEFQLLCTPCNSAKNNRMYFSDVQHLISAEASGITVTTWYADPIWQSCKNKVSDRETALRLSRIMRDNRNIAMMLLHFFMEHKEYAFLLSLLNLPYADYQYDIIPGSISIKNQIVTAVFEKSQSTLKYVNIQKARKVRVAFSSLEEYAGKENRNGYTFTNQEIEALKSRSLETLSRLRPSLASLNNDLEAALSDLDSESAIERTIGRIDCGQLARIPEYSEVKRNLVRIMEIVADALSSMWDSPRYSRETE